MSRPRAHPVPAGIRPREVTLYIPAYNAARTLPAAIDSVRSLRPGPAKFLVVADARSGDATLAIARRSGAEVLIQEQGRLGFARNMAIEHCPTTWLASCDADVVLESGWLGALCAAADDQTAAVGGGTLEMPHTPADRWRAVNMPHNWGPLAFDHPFMLVSEMLAQAEALRAVGGYLPDLRYGEDSDLCQRLRHAGMRLRYQPAAVAHHDRADSVASVLELRWNYAHHRQRRRFESLPGLTGKLAVNRAYALQSLSRTLHSEAADTCAIAALIWFHHALRDVRAALQRWPLIDAAARQEAAAATWDALRDGLDARWQAWLADASQWLDIPNEASQAAPMQATPRDERRFAALPGFAAHCAALTEATRAFTRSIPAAALTLLERSCTLLRHGNDPAEWSRSQSVTEAFTALNSGPPDHAEPPTSRAWRWSELKYELRSLGNAAGSVRIFGPALADEVPPEGKGEHRAPRAGLALVPHLECVARPESVVAEALQAARLAVLGYRTPERAQLSRAVWTARDLAVATAGSGGRILDFHTEAGFTRLVVSGCDEESLAADGSTMPDPLLSVSG